VIFLCTKEHLGLRSGLLIKFRYEFMLVLVIFKIFFLPYTNLFYNEIDL